MYRNITTFNSEVPCGDVVQLYFSVWMFCECRVLQRRIRPILDNLRGGGGFGEASCFGEATSRIITAVTSPLRIDR
ncbi:hypothetical protein PUN28_008608 [Cardiocondyla obscurior]|uniref:Uncharacterized protein n=1 Tax=Cardiocondyla obscurior TaxID=286306 RepID=A0AAW2G4M1_9HYME